MPDRDPMICSRCGIPMNRHAAKVVEPRSAAEARGADLALGGMVTEVHACRSCGSLGSRRLVSRQ
jgi:NMD protein affecting ribosome stability and mRNA decay